MENISEIKNKISKISIDSVAVHELRSLLLAQLVKFSIFIGEHWFINGALIQALGEQETAEVFSNFIHQTRDYYFLPEPIVVLQSNIEGKGGFFKKSRELPDFAPYFLLDGRYLYLSDIRLGAYLLGYPLVSVHTQRDLGTNKKFLKFNTARGYQVPLAVLAQVRFNLQYDSTGADLYAELWRKCQDWHLCVDEARRLKEEGFTGDILLKKSEEDYKTVRYGYEISGEMALISREDESEKLPKDSYRGDIQNMPWDYWRRVRSRTLTHRKLPKSVRESSLTAGALGSGVGYELVLAHGLLLCVKRKGKEKGLGSIPEGKEDGGSDGEAESGSEDEEHGDTFKILEAVEEGLQEEFTKPVLGVCKHTDRSDAQRFFFL